MQFVSFILQDWAANKANAKGRVITLLFRIANFCATRKIYFYLGIPYLVFYKILVEWFFSMEIPWRIKAGKGLIIYHGQGLVINHQAVIGEYCTLRHCTTIGNKHENSGSPVIGNYVNVGSNACIIGDIHIGDHVTIGCGSVVVRSIPANTVVAGNPAAEIKKRMEVVA